MEPLGVSVRRKAPAPLCYGDDKDSGADSGGAAGGGSGGEGGRGACLIDSRIYGVIRFISSVMRAASSAVPITRGVIRSRSSVFRMISVVVPKR